MDYARALREGHAQMANDRSRLAYLSDFIFDFTTYDDEKAEVFARHAIEVCEAINNCTTFDYIKDPGNYTWYLIMVNMPFFADKLNWGTSVRGAWWDGPLNGGINHRTFGLWLGRCYSIADWKEFIAAVIDYGKGG